MATVAAAAAAPASSAAVVGARGTSRARRDLPAELAVRAQGKPTLGLVSGHVDAGKSTMMGRLLVELGDVADKTIKKVLTENTATPERAQRASVPQLLTKCLWAHREFEMRRRRAVAGDVGARSQFERDAQRIGKASFVYAWVLDETDEERARSVSARNVDIAHCGA